MIFTCEIGEKAATKGTSEGTKPTLCSPVLEILCERKKETRDSKCACNG